MLTHWKKKPELCCDVSQMSMKAMRPALCSIAMRHKSVSLELRSGRVGKMNVKDQESLDKLFERTGALGLVTEDAGEEEEVQIMTKLDELNKDQVYQIAYGADEGDGIFHCLCFFFDFLKSFFFWIAFDQFDGEEYPEGMDFDEEAVIEEEEEQPVTRATSGGGGGGKSRRR